MTTIQFTDDDGNEHELPTKYEVCHQCNGHGSHVNPSIDGHGISREEFDADPDFEEAYFAGRYDVQCYTCKGLRVVPEVDETQVSPDLLAAYHAHLDSEAEYRQMCRMERMMGA